MAKFAEKLAIFLHEMDLASVILIGHSMGGMIAQILASKLKNKCKGLVLSCTHKGRAQPENIPLSEDIQKRMEQRLSLNDEDFGALRVNRMLAGQLPDNIRTFWQRSLAKFVLTASVGRCGNAVFGHQRLP